MADIEQTQLTLDDLMTVTHQRTEIIDGAAVEKMAASGTHHIIARNIFRILDAYCVEHNIGEVFFDGLHYLMFSSESGLKDSFLPDTSFIRHDNIPADWQLNKPYPGVPNLAVEVISPSESADEVQTKLRTYMEKGTEQVWIVYPKTREVYQYINSEEESLNVYRGSTALDVAAMFPGMKITTDQIFAMPPWAT